MLTLEDAEELMVQPNGAMEQTEKRGRVMQNGVVLDGVVMEEELSVMATAPAMMAETPNSCAMVSECETRWMMMMTGVDG